MRASTRGLKAACEIGDAIPDGDVLFGRDRQQTQRLGPAVSCVRQIAGPRRGIGLRRQLLERHRVNQRSAGRACEGLQWKLSAAIGAIGRHHVGVAAGVAPTR